MVQFLNFLPRSSELIGKSMNVVYDIRETSTSLININFRNFEILTDKTFVGRFGGYENQVSVFLSSDQHTILLLAFIDGMLRLREYNFNDDTISRNSSFTFYENYLLCLSYDDPNKVFYIDIQTSEFFSINFTNTDTGEQSGEPIKHSKIIYQSTTGVNSFQFMLLGGIKSDDSDYCGCRTFSYNGTVRFISKSNDGTMPIGENFGVCLLNYYKQYLLILGNYTSNVTGYHLHFDSRFDNYNQMFQQFPTIVDKNNILRRTDQKVHFTMYHDILQTILFHYHNNIYFVYTINSGITYSVIMNPNGFIMEDVTYFTLDDIHILKYSNQSVSIYNLDTKSWENIDIDMDNFSIFQIPYLDACIALNLIDGSTKMIAYVFDRIPFLLPEDVSINNVDYNGREDVGNPGKSNISIRFQKNEYQRNIYLIRRDNIIML